MPSTATATLLEVLRRAVRDEPAARRAVAYSGGRDSAVLLWGLTQVVNSSELTALHVDHGWRPADERSLEEETVRSWCATLGVSLQSFAPPNAPMATEAAAREHRYRCFETFLEEPGLVYLAHHADDQAETILMRLLKGRSWAGLSGMPARRGPYRRPLLGLRSELLAQVAAEQHIPWHTDSTNDDPRWTRNYLRTEILPRLQTRFPQAVEALGEFARLWPVTVDPHAAWSWTSAGARLPEPHWNTWTPLEREAQLLAVASRVQPGARWSRRFLETLCRGPRNRGEGGGWSWSRQSGWVVWKMVAPASVKEYFIQAGRETWFDLGSYRFCWNDDPSGLALPALDPERPWVWRSASSGLRFASQDSADWGKAKRRHRLGSLDPANCALVVQDGLIRAVVAPNEGRVVWSESPSGKLHNRGIFVTLVAVTRPTTE